MDFDHQIRILQSSGLIHSSWYNETYRDVPETGLSAVEHYLRYGARIGRNPGKDFHTKNYLRAYPDVAQSGLNPLLHYVLHGRAEGRLKRPSSEMLSYRIVERVRGKLLGMGFTEPALAELERLASDPEHALQRALASRELALWKMREKTPESYRAALVHLANARKGAPDDDFLCKISTAELLCYHFLGEIEEGIAAYETALASDTVNGDTLLARANFASEISERLDWINRVLRRYDIPPLRLTEDSQLPAYDRLTAVAPPNPVDVGPKVTVLVAAYAARDTIGTTLRALAEQSWRNLEILVLDDCSPDDTCEVVSGIAQQDPRIRLIRMERNGGAYVARNRGLDEATGEFVTLNDADDWSHPLKIETQVRHLMSTPEAIACTSQQARALSDLKFTRWTGRGNFIIHNTSSLMFRRGPVMEQLGYWDTVRFAADSELIRRMQRVFGKDCVHDLPTGPLSFQRDSESSVVADDVMGMNGFYFGVRKEYFDAQRHHHSRADTLKYSGDPANRPFPVPPMMRPERKQLLAEPQHFDVILAGDFRLHGPRLKQAVEKVATLKADGKRVGLVELFDYSAEAHGMKRIHETLRKLVDGQSCRVLVFGETVSCDRLEHVSGSWDLRFLPKITIAKDTAD
ncbi:glycosyltransferase [Lutimaribacter marinistellae]|uniref:Glycosyltransferase n=1 Tax=Lutimaribacter marinistellae TaxID=1820329 RepID=A0ABV7TCP6_9RHOB